MMRTRLALGIAVLDLVAFVVAAIVDPNADYGVLVLLFVGIAVYGSMGVLLVSRVPANPIGGLLLATATSAVAMVVIGAYGDLGAVQNPPWAGFDRAQTMAGAMFIYPFAIALVGIPLVFPDGRLPSPRFRWIVVLTIVGMIAWLLSSVFDAGLDVVVLFSVPIAFGGAMLAVSLRFRRGDPIQRQQVKWLAVVVIVGAATVLAALLLSKDYPDLGSALFLIGLAALFALPVVIGLAILRYRLYEIDRIISRTISYSVVTGLLAATFAVTIIVLQSVLTTFTGGQTIAVAASTLAAFALFQPLLRRVRRAVDRRFDRARYDAERTAAAFSERLRDEVDMDTVTTDLAGTAASTLAPATLSVWLRPRGGTR